jgi:hypothetical protein
MDHGGPSSLTWSTVVSSVDTNGDMSVASITSNAIRLANKEDFSVRLAWTSTPTGTISVEVSNDWDPVLSTGNWETLDSTFYSPALTHPAGSASSQMIMLRGIVAEYARVKYTRTGSSGTLTGKAVTREG